jgi:4-hydroxy-tetrahydrodipicolinate synthase
MPALTGLFVPLITPFDDRGRVDVKSLEQLGVECLDQGASGLVALATTAEASSLDEEERSAVLQACAAVCTDRGVPLLVGAGTNSTRTTIVRHEELLGVDGVTASLAVVPYYVRPSEAGIVEHFQVVAARSPVPLVIYNIPYRTGRGLGAASLLELAATPNIIGVKQAVGGIDADTLSVLADAPDSFGVLAGDDPYIFPLVAMGAAGSITASAHLCTARFAEMVADGLAGRLEQGRKQAEALLPLTLALFAEPSPAVIKAALHAQGRIPTADVRLPLTNASATALKQATAVLSTFGSNDHFLAS